MRAGRITSTDPGKFACGHSVALANEAIAVAAHRDDVTG